MINKIKNKKLVEIIRRRNEEKNKFKDNHKKENLFKIKPIFNKIKIKKSALLKANFYSTIAPILFNKSVEAMGYLVAPKGINEDVVNDIYLSHNQTVTSSTCTGDPSSEMNSFKKIQSECSKIIGWWHSHGLDYGSFHSLTDVETFEGISYSIFPNNKISIDNFVDISNLDDSAGLSYSQKDDKNYLMINSENNDPIFRLSIGKINSDIVPLLKDIKINKVEKADPIKISFSYSMVTNSKNMQPYLEVSYKCKGDEKINYVKGKDVTLEVIDDEKLQFEDYKRLVDDVSKRVHYNGKLPTRNISDYELRKIINEVETRVNNFNMTVVKPSEKKEEINKSLESIVTKTPEEKLKDKGEEQKTVYKKDILSEDVKQLQPVKYKDKLENLAEEKKTIESQREKVVHKIKDNNLEEILDKYNNHKELTRKQICNEYNINNYTLDKILREAENKGYRIDRRANKISDEHKADIINLYNNTNVKVKDLRNELNKNRQENEPEKKFSTSTLYRILHKYENNGNNVNWRRKNNKKEPPNIIRYNPINYISNILKDYSAKTKGFIKRAVQKYWKIGLISALSLAIGAGSLMYATRKPNKQINYTEPTKKIEQIIEKENTAPLVVYNPNNKVNYAGEDITQHIENNKTATDNQANKREYMIQKGDTLWDIMDKETGKPGLWEIVYASNENPATTLGQKNRQLKIREFGKKYNIESLKNAGINGSLKPYELKDQCKIKDKTKIQLSKTLSDDISKLNPQLQKEFNKIFYKASG
ncbi:MAG: hypothetical protein KJ968_03880 [Nanoarchaeota archaeon]|nr:hypothetical protein [Nanoarchaeota archaeon]